MPRRPGAALLSCAVLAVFFATASAQAADILRVRRPACPPIMYSGDPAVLYQTMADALSRATSKPRPGKLVALILPSSAWKYTADMLAQGYNLIDEGQYDRVIVITPSHTARFDGASVASVSHYRTPLADTELDGLPIERLCRSVYYTQRSVVYRPEMYEKNLRNPIHETEHGVEIQLPFLQLRLGRDFRLVPIVVDQVLDIHGKFNALGFKDMAAALARIINERTLIVVSSNMTRYGPDYGYIPFESGGDWLKRIEALDTQAIGHILEKDVNGFVRYVEDTGNEIQGRLPIALLMSVVSESAVGVLLDYDQSARTSNDPYNSVSYAAIAFYDPEQPPAEKKPVKSLLSGPDSAKPEQDGSTAPQKKPVQKPRKGSFGSGIR